MSITFNYHSLMENANNGLNDCAYYPVEESFFRSALEFIQEQQNEIRIETISFYEMSRVPLTEAGIQDKFNEFRTSVQKKIEKILEFIKNIINRFVTAIKKNLSVTNQALKLKDGVLKFSHEASVKYVINGYINRLNDILKDPRIPSEHSVVDFLQLDSLAPKYMADAFSAFATKDASKDKKVKALDDFIKKSESMADAARGAIIGKTAKVSSDEYLKFLKDEFIGPIGDVTVDYDYLSNAFDNITEYKDMSTKLRSTYDKIRKEYLDIQRIFFTSYPNMRYQKDVNSMDIKAHLQTLSFSKRVWGVINRRMQDHLLAFTTKLDCINKLYRQDMNQIIKVATKAKFTKLAPPSVPAVVLNSALEDFSYDMFLMENHIGNLEVKDYLVRNVLKEGSVDIMYEASLQEAINTIVKKIADIFANYSHKVNSFFKIDKKFFDDNKDIILKNSFKSFKLKDLYTYNVDKMKEAECPPLDITSMDKDLESKDTFIKAEFNFYASNQKDDASFFDTVKSTLRGALREEVDASTLDPAQLLRFCQEFDNTVFNAIRRDIKTLQTSNNNISTYIKQLNKDNSKADIQNDSYINTSDIIAGYFNEDGEQQDTNTQQNNTTSKAGIDKTDTDKVKDDIKVKVDNGEKLSDIKNKVSNYFKVCGDFLGGKMAVSIEAYNDYKRILKWHVKQYGGSDNTDGKASTGDGEGPIDIERAADEKSNEK